MIIVSSCLAGECCRYNGTHRLIDKVKELVEENKAMMICPELAGGFTTPREPAEIVGGTGEDVLRGNARVIEKSGMDVTTLYLDGAYKALKLAKNVKATLIILKEDSPSCGSHMIYNGEFSNRKIAGNGVTAALLQKEGFKVISEHQLSELTEYIEKMKEVK